jgi:hypothetical protein
MHSHHEDMPSLVLKCLSSPIKKFSNLPGKHLDFWPTKKMSALAGTGCTAMLYVSQDWKHA